VSTRTSESPPQEQAIPAVQDEVPEHYDRRRRVCTRKAELPRQEEMAAAVQDETPKDYDRRRRLCTPKPGATNVRRDVLPVVEEDSDGAKDYDRRRRVMSFRKGPSGVDSCASTAPSSFCESNDSPRSECSAHDYDRRKRVCRPRDYMQPIAVMVA
jgi:hypothetical protein